MHLRFRDDAAALFAIGMIAAIGLFAGLIGEVFVETRRNDPCPATCTRFLD